MVALSIDTADCGYSEPVDVWQRLLTDYLVPFEVVPAPDIPFRGQMSLSTLGPVDVVVSTRTACANRRPQRVVTHVGYSRAGLSLHLAGGDWVASEDRSETRLRPGDLVLWDLSRPMTLTSARSVRVISIVMPIDAIVPGTKRLLTSAATVLPTDGGIGSLVEAYLRQLATLDSGFRPDLAARLGLTTMDLLTIYFGQLLGETADNYRAVRQTQLYQAKTYIETHLGSSDLCPSTIAAAQHISVRLLYKLFAADDQTVAGYIRERRLERVRHDLLDPRYTNLSLTGVASRWGFTDSAHFSRVFKAAYGSSPSDYRRLRPVVSDQSSPTVQS